MPLSRDKLPYLSYITTSCGLVRLMLAKFATSLQPYSVLIIKFLFAEILVVGSQTFGPFEGK